MLPLCHGDPKWEHSPACSDFLGGVPPIPVLYRLLVPAWHAKIYAKSKLLVASRIFTNSCENSKILSLSQKFVYDHCCCPKSAIILTTSKMEAILDFWQGHGKTAPNEKGEKGGGLTPGPLILITWPQAVRQTRNVEKGGGVRCVSGRGSIKILHATVQNRKKLNFF
jgi:hypothetical protein